LPICQGKERTEHPTQKPEKLIEPFIKYWTNEGDIILDPFLGSGTTMKVARDLNRNCIGIEIDEKYIEMTKKRLNWEVSLDVGFEFKKIS
jgi:DNA modification methylase